MRLAGAERKSISGNLFQNPAGPDYKVGQSLFRKPAPTPPGPEEKVGLHAQPLPDRPREGRSGSVDDRLVKKWMSEVRTFNPTRESFRSWLVRAELRMEDGWNVGMRLNYLKSKLEPSEIVKLEQIVQLMDAQGTPRSWQAIRERALQVFPGAIDPDAAEFKLLAQQQEAGEPFGKWADRLTDLYIEIAGEIPQPGLLDEIVFNGMRVQYKLEWRAMQPHNLLDARWRFTQLEQKKWQELGIPNPAEAAGSGIVHLATAGGALVHPDRVDRVANQTLPLFTTAEGKGQIPDGHADGKSEARSSAQADRPPRRSRKGSPRKPGGDRDGEARWNSRDRAPRRDFDRPSEQRESRGRQYQRSDRHSGNRSERARPRSPVKDTRFRREDRDDRVRRNGLSRADWGRPARRSEPEPGWRPPMGRGRPTMTGRGQQFPAACGFCGRFGHVMRNCRDVGCFHCGRKGHLSTECRRPHMGRQQDRHQPQSGGGIPAYAVTPDVRDDNGAARQEARGQVAPAGVPGGQRSAIDEVTRTAKILSDQLQNMAGQKFAPIFPL